MTTDPDDISAALAAATEAIDTVLQWRAEPEAGDEYPFGWPDSDYEEIATTVIDAIGLAALLEERAALVDLLSQLRDANACGLLTMRSGIWTDVAAALTDTGEGRQ